MAKLLWGKVFYQDLFAGILREEPGDGALFEYDSAYLAAKGPAIAQAMPTDSPRYLSQNGVHPFFDNLVAEGWLEQAQTRLLGKRRVSRFELLLAFGYDCAGAVSVLDPEPARLSEQLLDVHDAKEMAVLSGRASLSGVQAKVAVVARDGRFFPVQRGQLSTHIAKFPSTTHTDLLINEYVTTRALKALLPDDEVADLIIGKVEGIEEQALIIRRFDRSPQGRVHFEEFNQLLQRRSQDKYAGGHKEMSEYIRAHQECIPVDNYRLYARIIAGLLLGNTDMHFKNFAMFNTPAGLRLTPSYDQVAAALYEYKTVALAIGGAENLLIGNIKPKNLLVLADEFNLPPSSVVMAVKQLQHNREAAKEAIVSAKQGSRTFKDQLIKLMDTRWNGSFASIGKVLSTKQSSGAKNKN